MNVSSKYGKRTLGKRKASPKKNLNCLKVSGTGSTCSVNGRTKVVSHSMSHNVRDNWNADVELCKLESQIKRLELERDLLAEYFKCLRPS